MVELQGVDVSNFQGVVDWPAVAAAGYQFAFAKATEGTTYTDSYMTRNWNGMRIAGLTRGLFHFARPSISSAQAEAHYFTQAVGHLGGLLPGDLVALDMEDTNVAANVNLFEWVLDWMVEVEDALHVQPVLYTGDWYAVPHGLVPGTALDGYPLWLAHYAVAPPALVGTAGRFLFWQHSDTGKVPGVVGNCDLDKFFGTAEELRALGFGATNVKSDLQNAIDVTHGWSVQMAQASKELQDVSDTLKRVLGSM